MSFRISRWCGNLKKKMKIFVKNYFLKISNFKKITFSACGVMTSHQTVAVPNKACKPSKKFSPIIITVCPPLVQPKNMKNLNFIKFKTKFMVIFFLTFSRRNSFNDRRYSTWINACKKKSIKIYYAKFAKRSAEIRS